MQVQDAQLWLLALSPFDLQVQCSTCNYIQSSMNVKADAMAADECDKFIAVSKRYRDYDVCRWLRQLSPVDSQRVGDCVKRYQTWNYSLFLHLPAVYHLPAALYGRFHSISERAEPSAAGAW
jgi:hypothetical protein